MKLLLLTVLFFSSQVYAFQMTPNDRWNSIVDDETEDKTVHLLTYEKFLNIGSSKDTDISKLKLSFPIKDVSANILTRFGTPTIVRFFETMNYFYLHEAIDIARSKISISDNVYAPVSGRAIIISKEDDDGDYSTVIAILDEKSNLVVSLLHVIPSDNLADDQFVKVKRGELIGRLSPVISMNDPIKQESYKHTHLALIDLSSKKMVNPNTHLDKYTDKVEPKISGLSLFDELGIEQKILVSGKLDLVVKGFDRDGINDRNFEIRRMSAIVKDENDTILFKLDSCDLDFLTSPISRGAEIKDAFFMDFIGQYTNKDFVDFETNASVDNREFSYVVTNFKTDKTSCSLISDEEGDFIVSDLINKIKVEVTLFDDFNNTSKVVKVFER